MKLYNYLILSCVYDYLCDFIGFSEEENNSQRLGLTIQGSIANMWLDHAGSTALSSSLLACALMAVRSQLHTPWAVTVSVQSSPVQRVQRVRSCTSRALLITKTLRWVEYTDSIFIVSLAKCWMKCLEKNHDSRNIFESQSRLGFQMRCCWATVIVSFFLKLELSACHS